MNEQTSLVETETVAPEIPAASTVTPPNTVTPNHNPVANLIARLSIAQMTLGVVLVIFMWQWYDMHRQIDNMQQELARRLTDMEGNNKASQMLVTQGQETTREISAKVTLLEAHYAEAQNQRVALESLYQELSSSRDETVLAQVEQMLLIAGQQLHFSSNVKAALIAMQQADDYLKRMDRTSLNGLRKTLAQDMDKLRALPNVDVPGINLRLDNLIAMVDTLPLAQDIRLPLEAKTVTATPPAESGWQRLVREIWEDAKHLVRIENMQKQELPLLSPTQVFFLRENLKLRLLSARLALLSRDETSFKHDLKAGQEWVTRYFDIKSPEGTQANINLQLLRVSNIAIDLPDVSASLEAVRNYRVSTEKVSSEKAVSEKSKR